MMRALITSAPGGWANTKVTETNLRDGRPDEVLVKIQAVGLNPADNFLIEGMYPGGPKPPFIPGRDACGVVVRGDAGGQWKTGDAVVTLQTSTTNLADGTLCEQQWFAAENLAPKPASWSDAEAAAAPLVYLTAWKTLVDAGGLHPGQPTSRERQNYSEPDSIANLVDPRPGQQVVVTGASGGVGLAAVQLASAYGATVVALSRSKEKQSRLKEAGALHVFSPDEPHLKDKICEALGSKGVHLVVETVGGPSLTNAIHLLGIHGRVSVVGVLAGVEATIPIPALMFKRASIHGVLVTDDAPTKAQAAWQQIVDLMARSRIRPIVDSRFPLNDAPAAFEKLRSSVFGKVVVEVG